MNCPNCKNEMERGHLSAAGYRILWTDRDNRLTAWKKRGEEVIESPSFFGELHNIAYICKKCRNIIVEY